MCSYPVGFQLSVPRGLISSKRTFRDIFLQINTHNCPTWLFCCSDLISTFHMVRFTKIHRRTLRGSRPPTLKDRLDNSPPPGWPFVSTYSCLQSPHGRCSNLQCAFITLPSANVGRTGNLLQHPKDGDWPSSGLLSSLFIGRASFFFLTLTRILCHWAVHQL